MMAPSSSTKCASKSVVTKTNNDTIERTTNTTLISSLDCIVVLKVVSNMLSMTTDASAFDVHDGTLLDSLQVFASKRNQNPFTNARAADSQILSRICEQQRQSALIKFCDMCEHFNLDPLHPYSIHFVLSMSSRHVTSQRTALQMLNDAFPEQITNIDTTMLDDSGFESPIVSNADWATILGFLEHNSAPRETLDTCAPLSCLSESIRSCHVPYTCETLLEFSGRVLLFMSPLGTPASRMVENLVVQEMHSQHQTPPHDIEFRIMRAITTFYDNNLETSQIFSAMLSVLATLQPSEAFYAAVRGAVDSRVQAVAATDQATIQQRPSLRAFAKRLHVTVAAYHGTYASWVALQRFPVNISLRTQQILYFIRVQVAPVPTDFLNELFDSDVIRRTLESSLDQIDPAPLIDTTRCIRICRYDIVGLIDFREKCLQALSLQTRQTLTMAQVMQLYVCCFQHESVRELCWRAILPYWNFSLQKKCEEFVMAHTFEVEAVIKTILQAQI